MSLKTQGFKLKSNKDNQNQKLSPQVKNTAIIVFTIVGFIIAGVIIWAMITKVKFKNFEKIMDTKSRQI